MNNNYVDIWKHKYNPPSSIDDFDGIPVNLELAKTKFLQEIYKKILKMEFAWLDIDSVLIYG